MKRDPNKDKYVVQAWCPSRALHSTSIWRWRNCGAYDNLEEAVRCIHPDNLDNFRILYNGEEVRI